jgi:hypothetical protein
MTTYKARRREVCCDQETTSTTVSKEVDSQRQIIEPVRLVGCWLMVMVFSGEIYYWLVVGLFLEKKYYWLVVDKPNEHDTRWTAAESYHFGYNCSRD